MGSAPKAFLQQRPEPIPAPVQEHGVVADGTAFNGQRDMNEAVVLSKE